ncbi:MAG TPA: alpha-ketoglutarate-dependent dioxygenase AlkB [Hyphomicrobiaceae bacterium]|nr:alpha-ketoglutarate-dependent dioxygenase AlkB [Hyphomicrobiaceae bacterium]
MSVCCNRASRGFRWIDVGGQHGIWAGRLPPDLCWCSAQFDVFWALHPDKFHEVRMFGRLVAVPRWSEAYGQDYRYSGTLHRASPVPDALAPLLAWSKIELDERLNGVLVNWYDGSLGHKIGAHRDDEKELVAGAPIITISFGETRTFRLRRWKGRDRHDIEVADNSVLVIPYATNIDFTHEVPASKQRTGRRISVTLRAFGTCNRSSSILLTQSTPR